MILSGWDAVALPSVSESNLRGLFADEGLDWDGVTHVTATASLALAFRNGGTLAVDVVTLLDLLVMLGRGDGLRHTAEEYPGSDFFSSEDSHGYELRLRNWRSMVAARRTEVKIKFADRVRDCIRDPKLGMSPTAARIFDEAVHEFAWTVQALVASGFMPDQLEPDDEIGRHAVDVWRMLEDRNLIPDFTAVRNDLWLNAKEFSEGQTAMATDLRSRVLEVLDHVYGPGKGGRTIVWHGFHFFTPVQWRYFQMLRYVPGIRQLFIVHDDGESAVFETWRRYFAQWLMPAPRMVRTSYEPAAPAAEFRRALAGETVDEQLLAGRLSLVRCRTPAEFVSHWRQNQSSPEDPSRTLFAAGAQEIERVVGRFSGAAGDSFVDLAQLPVGAFLLAIHDCMYSAPGKKTEVRFTGRHLADIISSGVLDLHSTGSGHVELSAAFSRALPYFRGCKDSDGWMARAEELRDFIHGADPRLHARDGELSDVDRIDQALDNPLRLVPWVDISPSEADDICTALREVTDLVHEIASEEKQNIDDHLDRIKPRLLKGMQNLSEDHRRELEAKIEMLGSGIDDDVYVRSLVEVVHMILRREVDFGFTGDSESEGHMVRHLRSLDGLGFSPSDKDIHVANLADGVYPGRASAVGWPFRVSDFSVAAMGVPLDLLQLRAETSSVSDMYLLWLALDGVTDRAKVTLSWIENVGNETRNPSPLLTLLLKPKSTKEGDSVPARVGGVKAQTAKVASVDEMPVDAVAPRRYDATEIGDEVLAVLLGEVDARALASAHICARRFAIQWALGPSASWQAGHHQTMSYGNTRAWLVQVLGIPVGEAGNICDTAWSHLTEGERTSSLLGRRVYDEEQNANRKWRRDARSYSARPEFVLTLKGKMGSQDDRISEAYTAAVNQTAPDVEVVVPVRGRFLPPRPDTDEDVCFVCPVRDRCHQSGEPTRM